MSRVAREIEEGRNAFYADDRYEHGFREPRDHGAVGAFGGAGQYELADSLCGARYRDRTHGAVIWPLSGAGVRSWRFVIPVMRSVFWLFRTASCRSCVNSSRTNAIRIVTTS